MKGFQPITNQCPSNPGLVSVSAVSSGQWLTNDSGSQEQIMSQSESLPSDERSIPVIPEVSKENSELSEIELEEEEPEIANNRSINRDPMRVEESKKDVKKTKTFSCSNCGQKFYRKRYAVQHCKEKEPWRCPKCFKEILFNQNIKRHTETCNKPKPTKVTSPSTIFECTMCEKVFPYRFNLMRHKRKVHQVVENRKIVCDVKTCPFTANDEKQLQRHKTLNHSEKEKLKCNKCDSEFLSVSGLKKHVLTIHRLDCSSCFDSFANDRQLRQHRMIYHSTVEGIVDENANLSEIVVSRRIGEHAYHRLNNKAGSTQVESAADNPDNLSDKDD